MAIESVTLQSDFTIESGAELSVEFRECVNSIHTRSSEQPSLFPPASFLQAFFNIH